MEFSGRTGSRDVWYLPGMLHPEYLESLRKMTPAERLKLSLDLMDLGFAFLYRLPPEEIQRRLDLSRQPWNLPKQGESR